MATEAQKRAYNRYDAQNVTRVTFKVNRKTESDILAILGRADVRFAYIKEAIREKYGREVGYRYGMAHRGFSPGAQPKPGLKQRLNDPSGRYYDIIVYDRPLSREEIEDYELEDLNGFGDISGDTAGYVAGWTGQEG